MKNNTGSVKVSHRLEMLLMIIFKCGFTSSLTQPDQTIYHSATAGKNALACLYFFDSTIIVLAAQSQGCRIVVPLQLGFLVQVGP